MVAMEFLPGGDLRSHLVKMNRGSVYGKRCFLLQATITELLGDLLAYYIGRARKMLTCQISC